jgi:hypothetical protein
MIKTKLPDIISQEDQDKIPVDKKIIIGIILNETEKYLNKMFEELKYLDFKDFSNLYYN